MDTRAWFNDGTYSDLTIKLGDGTELKVHKIIICQTNEYFRKLCGPGSRFAESRQEVIELKEDDPMALNEVLRHIYKLPITSSFGCTWRAWLELRTAADKYLEAELSLEADRELRTFAHSSENPGEIFDIIQTLNNEMAHDQSLAELGDKIRQKNIGRLLKNDRFRAKLDDTGKEALWAQLDELVFAAGLEEKCYHLCESHKRSVFKAPSPTTRQPARCAMCPNSGYFGQSPYGGPTLEPDREKAGTAWIPK